ncbi:MAG: hypothetical protein H7328_02785 [Bdellovibrio sp.]|nr:hypothetical protein [Bdellovibrio sp.]
MLKKITAILMLSVSVLVIWGGFYFLKTTGLDLYSKLILFGLPVLGIILTYFYLKNRINAWFLMLPFALAYIVNGFR